MDLVLVLAAIAAVAVVTAVVALAFCLTSAEVWWLMLWCDSALAPVLPFPLPLSLVGGLTAASARISAWPLPLPLPLPA